MSDAISKAMAVRGWRSREEMEWIVQQLPGCKLIIEVGAWLGRTTKILCAACDDDAIVISVDHWLGASPGNKNDATTQIAETVGSENLFSQFCENLKDEIACGKLVIVRSDSAAGVDKIKSLGYQNADLIFIDADHKYEHVVTDILSYLTILKLGGILCGDDFGEKHPGVKQAVSELLPGYSRGPGAIWHWRNI